MGWGGVQVRGWSLIGGQDSDREERPPWLENRVLQQQVRTCIIITQTSLDASPVSSIGWLGNVIINMIDALPVRVDGRGARREGPVQVSIELVDDLLIHDGLKLTSKEMIVSNFLRNTRGNS